MDMAYKRLPEQSAARMRVHRAIKRGEIVRPDSCEECGKSSGRIEAAHLNYTDDLAIRWLCVSCHRKWDSKEPKGQYTKPMTSIRDRVVELRRVKASELQPHPNNWRQHPPSQKTALDTVLNEVGFAGAIIAREVRDDSGGAVLQILDGHLRGETLANEMVPVVVVDLNDEEADLLLATYDPLGAMANADKEMLASILNSIEADSEQMMDLLDAIEKETGAYRDIDIQPAGEDDQGKLDEKGKVECPECGHVFTP